MTVHRYRGMLVQRTRMEAFRAAIEDRVHRGAKVLEVGAGMATYSMFAARAGADRVWAVEGGPIVHVARHVVRDNGFQDVVELLEGWYPEMRAPERVDLAIYEDFDARLMDTRSWAVLDHIARHGLAPGGTVLPCRARVWICPAQSPPNLEVVAPFDGATDELYGLDWESSRDYAANTPLVMPITPDELVGEPVCMADISLLPPPSAEEMVGAGSWVFDEDVEIHGLTYWFEMEVGEGVWLTNAPGGEPGSWGRLFLPAPRAIRVPAGETLRAGVGFDPGPKGEPAWMRWWFEADRRRWSAHEFRSILTTAPDLKRLSEAGADLPVEAFEARSLSGAGR